MPSTSANRPRKAHSSTTPAVMKVPSQNCTNGPIWAGQILSLKLDITEGQPNMIDIYPSTSLMADGILSSLSVIGNTTFPAKNPDEPAPLNSAEPYATGHLPKHVVLLETTNGHRSQGTSESRWRKEAPAYWRRVRRLRICARQLQVFNVFPHNDRQWHRCGRVSRLRGVPFSADSTQASQSGP